MRIHGACSIVAAALGGSLACSFIGVRRPPPPPLAPDAPISCTQSRVAPVLDTAGAIGTPILGVTMWGLCAFTSAMQSWSSDPKHLNCGLVLGGTVLSTVAYTASAVHGYRATAECRRLEEQRRMAAPPPGPRPSPRLCLDREGYQAPMRGRQQGLGALP